MSPSIWSRKWCAEWGSSSTYAPRLNPFTAKSLHTHTIQKEKMRFLLVYPTLSFEIRFCNEIPFDRIHLAAAIERHTSHGTWKEGIQKKKTLLRVLLSLCVLCLLLLLQSVFWFSIIIVYFATSLRFINLCFSCATDIQPRQTTHIHSGNARQYRLRTMPYILHCESQI